MKSITLQFKVNPDMYKKLRIKKILLDAKTWNDFLEKITDDISLKVRH